MAKKGVSFKWAFREFIWPRRAMLSIGLLLIVIRSLAGLVLPYYTKFLVDDIVPNEDFQGLYMLLGIVASAIFVQAVVSFALTRLLSVEAQHLIAQLRAHVAVGACAGDALAGDAGVAAGGVAVAVGL